MIDLSSSDLAEARRILRTSLSGGEEVWVFGSRVQGSAKPWSDLDLLVRGERPLSTRDYYALMDAFEESTLSVRVDVLDWHRLTDDFRAQIGQTMEPLGY